MSINPLLIDLPEQIETRRLILRPPRVGEGTVVNAAILESIAELRPWMPWARQTPSVDDTETNLRQAISRVQSREDIRIQFHLKDGTFIGSSGVHRIDWSVPKGEIGYWCRTNECGKGYVTEAVMAITSFALGVLKMQRVEIRCDENNRPSAAVAERAGYALEGTLRNDTRDPNGSLRSTRVYSVVAPRPVKSDAAG